MCKAALEANEVINKDCRHGRKPKTEHLIPFAGRGEERDYKLEEKVDELQKSVNEMKENLMKVVEMISAYDITSIMGC